MKSIVAIFNWVIFPLTLVWSFLTLISLIAPYVSPEWISYIPLFGLALPLLFLGNLLLLVYWAFQKKIRTLIPAVLIAFAFGPISNYYQFNNEAEPKDNLKISTFNCNLFGYYQENWFVDSVIQILQTENSDVTLLQEVFSKEGSLEKLLYHIKDKTPFKHIAIVRLNKQREYGMCILSKFPIENFDRIAFNDQTGNMAMYADIIINHDKQSKSIRFYNIHLQSFRFSKTDYFTVKKAQENTDFDQVGTENIINTMREAYKLRARQVKILKTAIEKYRKPRILGGDFNDVPQSYTYKSISENLNDAFIEKGNGFETTYKGPFPSFRIDYIFASEPFIFSSYNNRKDVPGDHCFISSSVDLSQVFE